MNGYFELLTGEIRLDFGKESELEIAGFDDGADVCVHFERIVKKYTKIFGGRADIGGQSVRYCEGHVSVVIENDYFSFVLIECEEVGVHPGFDISQAVEEWFEGIGEVRFYGKVDLDVVCVAMEGDVMLGED